MLMALNKERNFSLDYFSAGIENYDSENKHFILTFDALFQDKSNLQIQGNKLTQKVLTIKHKNESECWHDAVVIKR